MNTENNVLFFKCAAYFFKHLLNYLYLCCKIYYAQSVFDKNGWECAFACLFMVLVCGHAMDCLLSFLLPTMIYIRQILSSGWVFFPLHYMPSSQLRFRVPEVFLEFRESTFVDVTETRWEVQNWSFVLRLCVVNDAWNARNVSEFSWHYLDLFCLGCHGADNMTGCWIYCQ